MKNVFKTPVLLSLTLAIVIIALRVAKSPFAITSVILGSLAGSIFLDLDYIIYAYFTEPSSDYAKTLATFIRHKDLKNAVQFVNYHRHDIKDRILNSGLFQVVLALSAVFVSAAATNLFVKTLVLSTFLNSLYRLSEEYFENRTDEWFWALKSKPNKKNVSLFGLALFAVLVYCLTII